MIDTKSGVLKCGSDSLRIRIWNFRPECEIALVIWFHVGPRNFWTAISWTDFKNPFFPEIQPSYWNWWQWWSGCWWWWDCMRCMAASGWICPRSSLAWLYIMARTWWWIILTVWTVWSILTGRSEIAWIHIWMTCMSIECSIISIVKSIVATRDGAVVVVMAQNCCCRRP